ncbi:MULTISPECIES: tRNA (adenine-N1)-methyltransferase [Anaerolinea]|uniref:tRNA (adenine-N1)-methyltransferase n=1 Tax=Anaerolinea TaxID=233189 RepID=UPI00261CF111|nr:tRNA (adenine-N1)-methyltransferase [Anaerolinea thermophila]
MEGERPFSPGIEYAREGDLVQLVGINHRNFIFRLRTGAEFQTHRGILYHDDLIGKPYGSQVYSHIGSPFFLLQPSLSDLLLNIRRNTQILYPKDIGYILVWMGIGPGMRVIEAGTGSGALTTAFAYMVGDSGRVYTYETREEMHNLARKNLAAVGLDHRVVFKCKDIAGGFDETGADALFLDLPDPWNYLPQVRQALKTGGFFGTLLPTTNQVQSLLFELHRQGFAFINVCEILLRYYRPDPARFRPTDRMVAHTGFLIFARTTSPLPQLDPKLAREISHPLEDAVQDADDHDDPA